MQPVHIVIVVLMRISLEWEKYYTLVSVPIPDTGINASLLNIHIILSSRLSDYWRLQPPAIEAEGSLAALVFHTYMSHIHACESHTAICVIEARWHFHCAQAGCRRPCQPDIRRSAPTKTYTQRLQERLPSPLISLRSRTQPPSKAVTLFNTPQRSTSEQREIHSLTSVFKEGHASHILSR